MSETTVWQSPLYKDNKEQAASRETTPGGREEVKWVVVTETFGLTNAQLIADSLQVSGIPARAWQEGAGRAIGLTIGRLGNGYVMVPEPFAAQARDFLQSLDDYEEEWWQEEE